jgi:ribulose-phosphate 3-epimerase
MAEKRISPSLICMDLCNLAGEVAELEALGCDMLHVDVIDGIFSPDMPLGVETVRRLRARTKMIFDAHLMSVNNAPYVDLLLESGIDRLCFHTEYEPRPSILLRKIKAAGVKAGLAVSPETKIEEIEYLLSLCDFVLLMQIDPGYAHLPNQIVYPQTNEKIAVLRRYMEKYGIEIEIEVDGRVGFEETRELMKIGADTFVSGSKGVFSPNGTIEENFAKLQKILNDEK